MAQKHACELQAIDRGLNEIVRGLQALQPMALTPDNKLAFVMASLATKSYHALHTAANLLLSGYYGESLALVRIAYECRLVALGLNKESDEGKQFILSALLDGEERLNYSEIAIDLYTKDEYKKKWRKRYEDLSVYAAHPRSGSLRSLSVEYPDEKLLLSPFPRYREESVNIVLYELLWDITDSFETVEFATAQAGISWSAKALPLLEELDALVEEIGKRLESSNDD